MFGMDKKYRYLGKKWRSYVLEKKIEVICKNKV